MRRRRPPFADATVSARQSPEVGSRTGTLRVPTRHRRRALIACKGERVPNFGASQMPQASRLSQLFLILGQRSLLLL